MSFISKNLSIPIFLSQFENQVSDVSSRALYVYFHYIDAFRLLVDTKVGKAQKHNNVNRRFYDM